METFADVINYVNTAAFALLGVIGFFLWRGSRSASSLWAFLAFGDLGLITIAGFVLERMDQQSRAVEIGETLLISLLLLFPYFLFRFAASFQPAGRWLEIVGGALTAAVIVWTILIPELPEEGESRSAAVEAFVLLILVQWTFLSAVVSIRFWRAGREQPVIARRRTRLLSIASGAMAIALIDRGGRAARARADT